jgi:hypothetical protein
MLVSARAKLQRAERDAARNARPRIYKDRILIQSKEMPVRLNLPFVAA